MQIVFTLVKIGLLAVTGIPLPIPTLLDTLTSGVDMHLPYLNMCEEILQDAVNELGDEAVKYAYDEVKDTLTDMVASKDQVVKLSRRLNVCSRESYESIRKLLLSLEGERDPPSDWRPKHTGLVCVTSPADGSVAWVSPAAVEIFEREGARALSTQL